MQYELPSPLGERDSPSIRPSTAAAAFVVQHHVTLMSSERMEVFLAAAAAAAVEAAAAGEEIDSLFAGIMLTRSVGRLLQTFRLKMLEVKSRHS